MKKELLLQWSTDNIDTSLNMVLLYAYNAKEKKLWDEITVLIWGASQKLVRDNQQVIEKVKALHDVNVRIIACQHCAGELNTKDALLACDIEVFSTGKFLTDWLQSGKPILTV